MLLKNDIRLMKKDYTLSYLIKNKYIKQVKHPELDLWIYNYTAKTQYEKLWTPTTMSHRGLIVSKSHVVASPFPKFFNYEEIENVPNEPFEVYEKLDGSLGILYWNNHTPHIATRGGFTSYQALWASKWIQDVYSDNPICFDPSLTYLFEIIFPGNRIVVDYEDRAECVLLAVKDTHGNNEMSYDQMVKDYGDLFTIAKRYDGIKNIKEITSLQQDNKEGFVIKFESGMRCKIKFDEYVRLHRLITDCTARRLWEVMREGQSIDIFLDRVPDEFYNWVQKTEKNLKNKYNSIEDEALQHYHKVRNMPSRKDMAIAIKDYKYKGVVFNMIDKKDYSNIIWDAIRPEHELPFTIKL